MNLAPLQPTDLFCTTPDQAEFLELHSQLHNMWTVQSLDWPGTQPWQEVLLMMIYHWRMSQIGVWLPMPIYEAYQINFDWNTDLAFICRSGIVLITVASLKVKGMVSIHDEDGIFDVEQAFTDEEYDQYSHLEFEITEDGKEVLLLAWGP